VGGEGKGGEVGRLLEELRMVKEENRVLKENLGGVEKILREALENGVDSGMCYLIDVGDTISSSCIEYSLR
jgi:hypothetical protein